MIFYISIFITVSGEVHFETQHISTNLILEFAFRIISNYVLRIHLKSEAQIDTIQHAYNDRFVNNHKEWEPCKFNN